jgi:hypothetical protein
MKGYRNSKSLEHLSLEGNNLGKYLKDFVGALKECSNLQNLNLAENRLVEKSSKYLRVLLWHCTRLKCLNLSRNRVSLSFLSFFGSQGGKRDLKRCLEKDFDEWEKKLFFPQDFGVGYGTGNGSNI